MPEHRTTWRDIAADLREAIQRGDYAPGARLPSQSKLIEQYGVASQTVANAITALRSEGLIRSLTGSGHYVRKRPAVIRSTRSRLSPEERAAGRGTFTTDGHVGGWTPRSDTEICTDHARAEVAAALGIEPGTEVLVRDRLMYADDEPVQLATSYLPKDITEGTAIEQENTGPGGIYARLEEKGFTPLKFDEYVRIGTAAEHESDQLNIPAGSPVFRITRIASAPDRAVEVNFIVLNGERFELFYTVE
jgi:GntR family transcriptional regulator